MGARTQLLFTLTLASMALAATAVLFIFLPAGWNVGALALMALVLGVLVARLRALRAAVSVPDPAAPDASADPIAPAAPAAAPARAGNRNLGRRLNRAFGPIAAGVIIDLVDLATFGPIGLVLGLPVGGLAGYWMGRALGLSRKASGWCALAAGIYCTIPGTEIIPLATLVGASVRFWDSGRTGDGRSQSTEP